MKNTFKFSSFANDTANDLVEAAIELTKQYSEKKADTTEYIENNKVFNESFMKYCIEEAGMKFTGLDMIKNPMITKKVAFRETFEAIIAQIITPVAPAVISDEYMELAEVRKIGFGETARFPVLSNELFLVNEIAEGVQRGVLQTLYNNEYTINCTPAQIAVFVDWYQVAAGIFDWGAFAYKMGRSFSGYIQKKIILALTAVITDMASAPASPYYAATFSNDNWATIGMRVSAANDNADVYALGTKLALRKILPPAATEANLQVQLGEEVAKVGFLNRYGGIPLIEIGNAMEPGTINTTATLVVPNNVIYFIAMGAYKPVKVVFEGQNVVVTTDPTTTADKTYGMHITMRVGVGTILGSKFGAMTV